MSKLPRSLLPFLLTIVALWAAMHLGIAAVEVPRAEAQMCPNTAATAGRCAGTPCA